MAQKVTITFADSGEPEIKVEGVAGGGCSGLTKDLESALGRVTADRKTSEFYAAAVKQQAKAGGAS